MIEPRIDFARKLRLQLHNPFRNSLQSFEMCGRILFTGFVIGDDFDALSQGGGQLFKRSRHCSERL